MNWSRFCQPTRKRNPEFAGPLRAARPAKGQSVRVADVALIGPLMIWGGTQASNAAKTPLGKKAGATLAVTGLGTMFYNAINYARIKQGDAR